MIRSDIEATIASLTNEVLVSIEQWRSAAALLDTPIPSIIEKKLDIIAKLTELLEAEDNRDDEDAKRRLDAYKTLLQAAAGITAFYGFFYSIHLKNTENPFDNILTSTIAVGLLLILIIFVLLRHISERKLLSVKEGFWKDIVAICFAAAMTLLFLFIINPTKLSSKPSEDPPQKKQQNNTTPSQKVTPNKRYENPIESSDNIGNKLLYPFPTIYISNDSSSYSQTYPTGAPRPNQPAHPKPKAVLPQKEKCDFCKCLPMIPPN